MKTFLRKTFSIILALTMVCTPVLQTAVFAAPQMVNTVSVSEESNIEEQEIQQEPSDDVKLSALDSGECGENLTWELEVDGTLRISGSGDMPNWDNKNNVPRNSYSSSIVAVEIETNVTSIGKNAFNGCSALVSVSISDTVKSIDNSAFSSCPSFKFFEVSKANECFSTDERGVLYNYDKTEIVKYPAGRTETEFSIPDGVTDIAVLALGSCHNLEKIYIPETVENIGERAFISCKNLVSIIRRFCK